MARKLTPQQMSFVAEIAAGNCTATEAALRSGYSPKSANKIASQLLDNPRIASEIERVTSKATATSVGSKAECLDIIWRTMQEAAAEGDRVNVYRGGELWLKATGQLVEKREVKQDQTVEIDWQAPIPEGGDEG